MASVASNVVFSYRESVHKHRKFRAVSCLATSNDFKKEMSSLRTKSSDVDQLKKAYRRMALRYHPDVCDPSIKEESTRMFIELQSTYSNLLNRESQKNVSSSESRNKWEVQLVELKRRSFSINEEKDGSWGSRMRAKLHGS